MCWYVYIQSVGSLYVYAWYKSLKFISTITKQILEVTWPICTFSGAIHNDLHDDNILILEKDSAMARTDPTDLKSSPYSDYGLVDFGDIVVSCTLFDLVTFLESIMRDHAAPPKEYVEHMRTVMDEACDGGQRPGQGRHLTPIDQPMYKGSDEKVIVHSITV